MKPINIPMSTSSSQFREKHAKVFWPLLLLFLIRMKTLENDKTGVSQKEIEDCKNLRLLPPRFKNPASTRVSLSELVWFRIFETLIRQGFEQQSIQQFRSLLFTSWSPFVETEEDDEESPTTISLYTIDCLLFYALTSSEELVLYFNRDGSLSLCPVVNVESDCSRNNWIGTSLVQLVKGLPSVKLAHPNQMLTKVDKAELALLSAARNPSFTEVIIVKPKIGAKFKWDLQKIQHGISGRKEIHALLQQSLSGYGEFKVTGNGQGSKTAYQITYRSRFE